MRIFDSDENEQFEANEKRMLMKRGLGKDRRREERGEKREERGERREGRRREMR